MSAGSLLAGPSECDDGGELELADGGGDVDAEVLRKTASSWLVVKIGRAHV